MWRHGPPVLPAIIGVILGRCAEQRMRRALRISEGDFGGPVGCQLAVPPP
jgi:TctA family transporter